MTAAGTLDIPITIEQAPVVRSSVGQKAYDWTAAEEVCRRRCRMTPRGGRETRVAEQTYPDMDWLIEMRGRVAIDIGMRIKTYDGRVFGILSVQSTDGKPPVHAETLRIVAKEGMS